MQYLRNKARSLSRRLGAKMDEAWRLGGGGSLLEDGGNSAKIAYGLTAAAQWACILAGLWISGATGDVIQAAPWVIPAVAAASMAASAGASIYGATQAGKGGGGGGYDVGRYGTLTPEQTALMKQFVDLIDSPPRTKMKMPYPGLAGGELTSLAALENMAMEGSGQRLAQEGETVLGDIMRTGPGDPRSLELFESSVIEPMMETAARGKDALTRKYAGRSRGSESAAAFDKYQGNVMDALAKEYGTFGLGMREDQLKALAMMPQTVATETDYLTKIMDAMGLPREQAEKEYGAGVDQILRNIAVYQAQLGALSGLGARPGFENIAYAPPVMQGTDWGQVGGNLANTAMTLYMLNKQPQPTPGTWV